MSDASVPSKSEPRLSQSERDELGWYRRMNNHIHDLTGQGDGWGECACGYRVNLGVKWVCRSCGYHPGNRAEWCAVGCGSDYNKMWKVQL